MGREEPGGQHHQSHDDHRQRGNQREADSEDEDRDRTQQHAQAATASGQSPGPLGRHRAGQICQEQQRGHRGRQAEGCGAQPEGQVVVDGHEAAHEQEADCIERKESRLEQGAQRGPSGAVPLPFGPPGVRTAGAITMNTAVATAANPNTEAMPIRQPNHSAIGAATRRPASPPIEVPET